MKAHPDPPAVGPIDAHAADAAAEQTQFDQDTVRRVETVHSAQEERSIHIWASVYLKHA